MRASPRCSRVIETPAVRALVGASLLPPRTLGQLPLQGPRVEQCLTPELSVGEREQVRQPSLPEASAHGPI